MSAPPPPPPPAGGEGLGRSGPLVNVAGGPPTMQHGQQQQSFTPVAENHPLAGPPPPTISPPVAPAPVQIVPGAGAVSLVQSPGAGAAQSSIEVSLPLAVGQQQQIPATPPPPPMQQYQQPIPPQQQQQCQQSPPQQIPYTLASPPPQQTPVISQQQFSSSAILPQPTTTVANINSPTKVSTANNFGSPAQSLDNHVDAFLSGPSYRTEQKLPPLLRPPPLINENPLQCLRTLVERRAWGDVLQVTADLLRGADSSHARIYQTMLVDTSTGTTSEEGGGNDDTNSNTDPTLQQQYRDETVEIVALQCHAWLKLRRYTDLGQEIERWNFLSFHENYDASTAPVWVPWSLHIIATETLLHSTDDPNRGVDELHALLSRIPDTDEDVRWKLSAQRALANAFSRKKEWRLAMVSLERVLPLLQMATRQEVAACASSSIAITSTPAAQALLEAAYRTEVLSVQGRYLLHAGAVAEAGHLYQTAQSDWKQAISDAGDTTVTELKQYTIVQHVPAQLLANEGLLCFAYANFDQSIECFKNATDSLRSPELLSVYRTEDWLGPAVMGVAPHASLFNECINNMAICALYTCRMPEAVGLMESLIREDPTAFLTERVAFNLCTMYELGCDTIASSRKKRVLQLVAKRFFLHDVGPESFRIS